MTTKQEIREKALAFLEIQRSGNAQHECNMLLQSLADFFGMSIMQVQFKIAELADQED